MATDHDDDLYHDHGHDPYDPNDGNDSHHDTASGTSRDSSDTNTTTDTSPDDLDSYDEGDHHIGRALSTRGWIASASISTPRLSSSSARQRPRDSHMGSPHQLRTYSGLKSDVPSTPPSRRTSLRSSRLSTPTTFIPSKKDRLRYSWQSLLDDEEPGKPRIHVIKIVSTASTASAGIGQEEAFGFSCSSGGRRIAVYNSARLFILQTAALPVNVSQEYALKRRPLAVEIVDDENVLAVLADEHTVNVYDISHQRVRRLKTIRPDHPTYTIALSRTGALLAAAYEGGVEVFSLAQDALVTDRRAIRSPRMDKLQFSDDGSTLLGTTSRLHASSTVIVSVPVFPAAADGIPTHEELKEAWCTGLLSPENVRNSSHATFWRERGNLCNDKLFAWNGLEDTFGIMNVSDLEYNNIACPIGVSQPLSAVGGLGAAVHSVPSVDESGTSVAMVVNQTTVRIYTVPQDVTEEETRVEAHSMDHELNDEYGCPFADVRWVHSHKSIAPLVETDARTRGRLIVTSPGGVFDHDAAEHSVQDIEGGRVIIFDFDPQYAGQPGQMFTFTLGKAPPQALDEETLDVAEEVDLVRRRTVTQKRGGTLGHRPPSLGRSATTMSRRRENRPLRELGRSPNPSSYSSSIQSTPIQETFPGQSLGFTDIQGNHRMSLSLASLSSEASRSLPDLLEASELAYEEPYTQGAPRSGTAIQRATTNANRHRFQALEERAAEVSDPEGLPLPIYSPEPNQPLPSKYRRLAGLDIPQTGRILYNPETATAPPVLSESYPDEMNGTFPMQDAYPSGDAASASNLPLRNLQREYQDAPRVSPIGNGRALAIIGDWENVSPLLSRMPTNGSSLRHQASWETVGTQRHYAASQSSHSPVSRSNTRTTMRPQQSFEPRSAGSPLMQRHQEPPQIPVRSPSRRGTPTQPQTPTLTLPPEQSSFTVSPPNFINDFRHSLLLPLDFSNSNSTFIDSTEPPALPVHRTSTADPKTPTTPTSSNRRPAPFSRAATSPIFSSPSSSSLRTASPSSPSSPVLKRHHTATPTSTKPVPTLSLSTSPSSAGKPSLSIEANQETGNQRDLPAPRPDSNIRAQSAPLTRSDTVGTTATNGTENTIISGITGQSPALDTFDSGISGTGTGTSSTVGGGGYTIAPSGAMRPSGFRGFTETVISSAASASASSVGGGSGNNGARRLINFSRKDVVRSKSVGYSRFGRSVGDEKGVGGIGGRGLGRGVGRGGGGGVGGRAETGSVGARGDVGLGTAFQFQTREEFRELEGQGKRCVVM